VFNKLISNNYCLDLLKTIEEKINHYAVNYVMGALRKKYFTVISLQSIAFLLKIIGAVVI